MSDAPFLILIGLFYFLPTVVAGFRGHLSILAIFLLNAVFGWAWIGWFIALVWACAGGTKRNQDRLLERALRVARDVG